MELVPDYSAIRSVLYMAYLFENQGYKMDRYNHKEEIFQEETFSVILHIALIIISVILSSIAAIRYEKI